MRMVVRRYFECRGNGEYMKFRHVILGHDEMVLNVLESSGSGVGWGSLRNKGRGGDRRLRGGGRG